MPITPDAWSVVVVGYWNRAILTPAGVAKRLFGLGDQQAVEVIVPVDAIAPFKVRHGNLTVMVARDHLLVQPEVIRYPVLVAAMEVARKALELLPETPVFAAGYNVTFRSTRPIDAFDEVTKHEWDNRISDQGYKIDSRSISRSLDWNDGKIRVTVSQKHDQSCSLLLNFEMVSNDPKKLGIWLSATAVAVQDQSEKIMFKTIDLRSEDVQYVDES